MAQQVDLSGIEELLMNSRPEELAELNELLASSGMSTKADIRSTTYTCDKKPTGPLNLGNLRNFMEETAQNEEDWPEMVPHVPKKTNSDKMETKKNDSKKMETKNVSWAQEEVEGELDASILEALEGIDTEELSELAEILGVPGLVVERESMIYKAPKQVSPIEWDGANETNLGEAIKGIEDNSLQHLNLNNMRDVGFSELSLIFSALKTNTSLQSLAMSSIRMTSQGGKILGEALLVNRNLVKLDLSSNFLSGSIIAFLVECINKNKTLKELRVCNQCPILLGNQAENAIFELVAKNDTLRVLSADFTDSTVRYGVQKKLQHNCFSTRRS